MNFFTITQHLSQIAWWHTLVNLLSALQARTGNIIYVIYNKINLLEETIAKNSLNLNK